MAVTSPYLDSDIVGAWNYQAGNGNSGDSVRQQIIARFPGRQVIDMDATGNTAWFADQPRPANIDNSG